MNRWRSTHRDGRPDPGRSLLALAALWLLLAATAQAADVQVRAFLDRDHARLGETVTLNVEVDGGTTATAPDVSALRQDFEVLGTSHNTSISIDNGRRSERTLWAVQLQPRHVGTLTIPSLRVAGHDTAPLTLEVESAPATAQGGPGDPVYIEVTPSTLTPYVGQQVQMTVRLFYAPNLNDGSIDKPQADGLQVRQLGDNVRYQAQRGGRRYHVVEQHFALIAQHAGHITLPALTFHGSLSEPGSFSGFFGGGRPVRARSAPVVLAVRARPASERNGPWLPARKVTLELSGLPDDGRVQVGEPFTLTLRETALGLPFESLPEPDLPPIPGARVYPDQPQDKTGNDGHWLHGERTRKFAVVPRQAGTLTIPAITLRWWDVSANRARQARLPAHTLTVTALPGAVASGGSDQPAVQPAPPPVDAGTAPGSAPTATTHWKWLALVALGLWLASATILAGRWWWRRRRASARSVTDAVPARADARRLRNAFLHAVRGADAAAQADALLAWARAEQPQLQTLSALAAALGSSQQREAVAMLQRARYAADAQAPGRDALAAAFAGGLQWQRADRPAASAPSLPPLYPP